MNEINISLNALEIDDTLQALDLLINVSAADAPRFESDSANKGLMRLINLKRKYQGYKNELKKRR